jgi:hypothetical protein
VRLSRPVKSHETTTAHIEGAPPYSPGAPITVVVDPQDPGYAELPGAPYASTEQWAIFLGIAVGGILAIPSIAGIQALRQSRSRRRLRRSLLS